MNVSGHVINVCLYDTRLPTAAVNEVIYWIGTVPRQKILFYVSVLRGSRNNDIL